MGRRRSKWSCLRFAFWPLLAIIVIVVLRQVKVSHDVHQQQPASLLLNVATDLALQATKEGDLRKQKVALAETTTTETQTTPVLAEYDEKNIDISVESLSNSGEGKEEPVPWKCPDFVNTPGLINAGHPSYTVEGLCEAAAAYNRLHPKRMFLGSDSDTFNRQELAAFLAHVKHESAGMAAVREYRCCTHKKEGICKEAKGKKNCHYCDPLRPESAEDSACPCQISSAGESSKLFYGRGPLQLSWNFHYGALAQAFGMPEICGNPDLVADTPELLWGSAVWYWMDRHDPNCVDDNCHGILESGRGFGGTTQNVNGCLECAGKQDGVVCHRADMFVSNCKKLDVPPLRPLDCGGRSCEKKADVQARPPDCPKCRSDFQCGSRGKLADGGDAECDAKGTYPCCSSLGWCGNSDAHCTCAGCVDYRNA